MASRPADLPAFVSAAGWRLLLALSFASGIAATIPSRHYATAFLLGAGLALALLDLWRSVFRTPVTKAAEPSSASMARRLDEALALLDAVTVALFVVDEDGRVRFANMAARRLSGFEAGRLHDIPGLDAEQAAAILALPPGGRQLLTLADGRSILVWTAALTVPGAGARRLVSMQNVAGELDAVQVGAWQLMTRVLAHEMMNSLTPIASLAESIAALTPAEDPRGAAAATIARRSEHLIGFVERYRAVVDLPEPRLAPLELAPFLEAVRSLMGDDLQARAILFSVDAGEADLSVQADAALLEQALLNLVKNATDAVAGVESPHIRLACTQGRGSVSLTVSDNGSGIEEARLEEVFVPFFTTKKEGGGIGLTLARQIVLAHGGRLSVRRLTPRGTAFEIRLPA